LTKSLGDKKDVRYAAIWTDENLVEKVLEQAEGFLEKLRKGSKVKLKVPILDFITYEYDYKYKGKRGIYFDKEVDLSEKIRVKTIPQLHKEIHEHRVFKPFIAQIEGNLILALHMPKLFREQLRFLREIPEISIESKKELDELSALPDPILQQKVLDSEYEVAPGQNQFAIIEKHAKPLISKYPSLRQDLMNTINREKPAIRLSFRGDEYITYFFEERGKPIPFPICFPVKAKYSLPNAPGFYAKVLGIVSFMPNPPLDVKQGFSPFFFRAVSLFLAYGPKETPKPGKL
jgi:hypothetical protein